MPTSSNVDVILRCAACRAEVDPLDPSEHPYRCPNADRLRDLDHVLAWDPVSAGVRAWPGLGEPGAEAPALGGADGEERNPFVRYRTLQHSYWLGRALGGTDADHVARVRRIDAAIASVAGTGFATTPMRPLDATSSAIGVDLWVKDDTGNVAGSHKARHLMGLLLELDTRRVPTRTTLAIASCGNAALAAATLARATRRTVEVFVPESADPVVLERLRILGARITTCPRRADDPPGDPCIHRFHEAVARGALPFCVQGPENGLTIDGGTTMGHELADQLALHASMLGDAPDRLFVQVGGGALGSSVFRGLRDAHALGVIERVPRIHPVQSEGAAPLARAWSLVVARALRSLGHTDLFSWDDPATHPLAAAALADASARPAVEEALMHALTHRSSYMWPWEEEPMSIAGGILDDETYDWMALVRAMLLTGGWPVVATEAQLLRAGELVASDFIDADETGSASVAGVIALRAREQLDDGERVAALITGIRRR